MKIALDAVGGFRVEHRGLIEVKVFTILEYFVMNTAMNA